MMRVRSRSMRPALSIAESLLELFLALWYSLIARISKRPLPDRLKAAAAQDDTAAVEAWLDAGNDLNARLHTHPGATMLMIAAVHGSVSVATALLRRGADATLLSRDEVMPG